MTSMEPEGVISLLDPEHSRDVEALWDRIETETGLRGVRVTPWPHFSYLIAEHLELDGLSVALDRWARRRPPFHVRAGGIGTFGGPWPVVYLKVETGPELLRAHREIWTRVEPFVRGAQAHYFPGQWVPHITLAQGETRPGAPLGGERGTPLTADEVESVVRLASEVDIDWTIAVDRVATVVNRSGRQALGPSFALRTPGTPPR
jgi:2'-5' RNA ligase